MPRESTQRTLRAGTALITGALILLAWPAPAVAQKEAGRPDTVRLRFAWPAGTTATVETTRFRERVTEKTDTVAASARYRMQVQQHPEGLLIAHDSFDLGLPGGPAGLTGLAALQERVADLVPSYVVNREGEFQRIHDVAGMRARVLALVAGANQAADSTGQLRAMLESLMSEQVFNGIAAQEWNALVGMWIGADLELGEAYEAEEEAPIPLLPGATVGMVSEFSIVRRLPCREGDAAPACVEVELTSIPDPDDVKRVIRQFMDRMAQQVAADPALANFSFESLDIENALHLVIEPATLLPHRARLSKYVEMVVREGGEKGEYSQLDVRTFRFTYR